MILNGTKTATRRNWKKPMVKIGGIYKCKLQMLSKEYFAKIRVTKLFKQKLGEMNDEDCQKEGYDNFASFMRIWIEINKEWNPKMEVYVIEFNLLKLRW